MELQPENIDAVLNGATFYGAGGGGARKQGEGLAKQIVDMLGTDKTITVTSASELDPHANVAIPAGFGAPTSMAHQSQLDQVTDAWHTLAEVHNLEKFDAVFPGEVGAANSMLPLALAARLGLPLVDGSGAARAMPSLQMSTCADPKYGLPASPIVMNGGKGKALHFSTESATFADLTMRGIISGGGFDQSAGIALWAMNAAGAAASGIAGTFTKAFEMGQALNAAGSGSAALMAAVQSIEPEAQLLVDGHVSNYTEDAAGGFDHTVVHVSGNGHDAYVTGQNENLLCWVDNEAGPRVIAPDLVCYLRPDTGQATDNSGITTGDALMVIGIPTPAAGRTAYVVDTYLDLYKKIGYCGGYIPFGG